MTEPALTGRPTGPAGPPLYHLGVSDGSSPVSTEAVMEEIRGKIRDDLHARLIGHGARDDFAERAIFDEVDRVFAQALAHDDPRALLLATRLEEPWRPLLSLEFPGHRNKLAAGAIRFAKSRLVLPVVRWLFEYSQENFRRQHHLNVVLMATVQTLAADHARLKARLAELERRAG